MVITSERLQKTFSEGGAQEICQEVKSMGDFLGFQPAIDYCKEHRYKWY